MGTVLFLASILLPVAGLCLTQCTVTEENGSPVSGGTMWFVPETGEEPISIPVGSKGTFPVADLRVGEGYEAYYVTEHDDYFRLREPWTYEGKGVAFAKVGGELAIFGDVIPSRLRYFAMFLGAGTIPGESFNGKEDGNEVTMGLVAGGEYYIPSTILPFVKKTNHVHLALGFAYAANRYEVDQRVDTSERSDVTYHRVKFRVGCSYFPGSGRGGVSLGAGGVFGLGGFYDGSEPLECLDRSYGLSTYGVYVNVSYGRELGGFITELRLEPSVSMARADHGESFWEGDEWSVSLLLAVGL
jgi:hypothetical protein